MQKNAIINGIKIFVVSFIVTAIGRAWLEQFVFGYIKSYESVAIFAGFVAIVIATAQIVLSPRPKPTMPVRSAPPAPAVPMYQAQITPAAPVYKTATRSAPVRKTTAKKSKKRK